MGICAAIAGRVPRSGLYLKQNRKGQVRLRLGDIEPATLVDDTFYPVLGHFLGRRVQDRVPVIEGLPADVTSDQFRAMGAAAASSGAVALFHAVGATPEAKTLEEAFQGDVPEQVIEVHSSDLIVAESDLSTAEEGIKLDAVVLGCPHFSFAEFRELERAIQAWDRPSHPDVRVVVFTNQVSYGLLQRSDSAGPIVDFGCEIVLDTCPFLTPIIASDTRVLMTNSGKCAYYAPGELGVQVAFGSLSDCVRSAVAGNVDREETLWRKR
jgi:predicted aconitase